MYALNRGLSGYGCGYQKFKINKPESEPKNISPDGANKDPLKKPDEPQEHYVQNSQSSL